MRTFPLFYRFIFPILAVVAFAAGTVHVHAQDPFCSAPLPPQCSPCNASYSPNYDTCGPMYDYGNAYFCAPMIYGRVESVFWNLEGDKRPLILRDVGGTDVSVFNGNDIDYDTHGSVRALVGLSLTPFTSIEGQYTGFSERRDSSHFGGGGLSLPGDLGAATKDYFLADSMSVFSETDMHSAELNLVRRTSRPAFSWLAGFRYINFDEKFSLNSMSQDSAPHWSSDYRINSRNNLYGGQIGLKWEQPLTERLGFQFLGKAGVFSNSARQNSWMGDENNTVELRNARASEKKTSFVGDLNVGAYIKVTENVQIVGGYNFLWIGDIARACDQIDFSYTASSGHSLRTDTAFLHGANIGVELRF